MAGGALAWGHPGSAQMIRELGVQAIGTFSDPGLLVAELATVHLDMIAQGGEARGERRGD